MLSQLLGDQDIEGVLIQADALHTQRPFSAAPRVAGRLPADGEGETEDPAWPDPQPIPGKAQDHICCSGSRDRPRPRNYLEATGQASPREHLRGLDRHQLDRGDQAGRHA